MGLSNSGRSCWTARDNGIERIGDSNGRSGGFLGRARTGELNLVTTTLVDTIRNRTRAAKARSLRNVELTITSDEDQNLGESTGITHSSVVAEFTVVQILHSGTLSSVRIFVIDSPPWHQSINGGPDLLDGEANLRR